VDSKGGGLGSPEERRRAAQQSAVAGFYETWWISPDGKLYDALREGAPGHCAWLEENFGICSRSEARQLGWVRVGWNLTRFYIDGKPGRIEANRSTIEDLLTRHAMVTEVLLEHGSDLDSIVTPQEFLTAGGR
jgi:hypothetical protein